MVASEGWATRGRSKRNASICHAIETSSTSLVRREGTTATSSRWYARRAFFPMPISTMSRTKRILSRRLSDGFALSAVVVRRLDRHLDVVRVALLEPGRRDLHEPPALVQLGDGARAGVPHGGAQPADELVRDRRQRPPERHLTLDALGHELVVGQDVVLE